VKPLPATLQLEDLWYAGHDLLQLKTLRLHQQNGPRDVVGEQNQEHEEPAREPVPAAAVEEMVDEEGLGKELPPARVGVGQRYSSP
jgi:hypothetical protein